MPKYAIQFHDLLSIKRKSFQNTLLSIQRNQFPYIIIKLEFLKHNSVHDIMK